MRIYKGKFARLLPQIISAAGLLLLQAPVFAQCSSAAWSSVTGTPMALGVGTSPAGMKYEQSCGLTVDAAAVPAYVTTNAPADETMFSVRFFVLAAALDIGSGDVKILTARDGGTIEVEVRLRSTGVVNHLTAYYRTGGVLTEISSPIPLQNIWHGVEVNWSAGSGDGSFELKLDDDSKFTRSDITNGSAVIDEIDLGVINAADASGELVFDAFDLRRSSSVGLLTINEMFGISTRADVRTVHEIVIGGFIITGDTDKCVVVRGRGQSVGVPAGQTRLADPYLSLRDVGGVEIEFNDNWQDFPEAQSIIDLNMQPTDPTDSAIYACLPPGAYTALVYGASGQQGIGIVEVFDGDSGTPFLASISTRSFVDTVHKVAIGGFIINGDLPKEVVIRGRGMSVGVPQGVTRLSDPLLGLYNSQGALIASNDNWGDAANAAAISAAGYAPGDVKDSVIMMVLNPGSYTAILSGVGGVTGVGIVEVVDKTGGSIEGQ